MEFVAYHIGLESLSLLQRDLLLGQLAALNPMGVWEEEDKLVVYFETTEATQEPLEQLLKPLGLEAQKAFGVNRDWNEEWEKNFQPILVGHFCGIRAPFHAPLTEVQYELLIHPKMAFGTGHHATTYQMIELIEPLDLAGKTVLDFGCGTGILSILAEKKGAKSILAIDIDDWAVTNALENCDLNDCHRIEVKKEMISTVNRSFDCIFANINRKVLLSSMPLFPNLLKAEGVLLLSGILAHADEALILVAGEKAGLQLKQKRSKSGWQAMEFYKKFLSQTDVDQ